MSKSLYKRVHILKDALFQKIDNEGILLNMQDECYYGFDEVASRMWELLFQHKDTTIVMNLLLEEYEIDEVTLRNDLVRIIDELVALGIVQVDNS